MLLLSAICIFVQEWKIYLKICQTGVKNPERMDAVQAIAYEHQVDDYLAGILYASIK